MFSPLAVLLASAACATTPGVPGHSLAPALGSWSALGSGPIYPLVDVRNGSVLFAPNGGWDVQKVFWATRPGGAGSVTLEGSARFVTAPPVRVLGRAIRIPAGRTWRTYPTEVAVRGAGCLRIRPSSGAPVVMRVAVGLD